MPLGPMRSVQKTLEAAQALPLWRRLGSKWKPILSMSEEASMLANGLHRRPDRV